MEELGISSCPVMSEEALAVVSKTPLTIRFKYMDYITDQCGYSNIKGDLL